MTGEACQELFLLVRSLSMVFDGVLRGVGSHSERLMACGVSLDLGV